MKNSTQITFAFQDPPDSGENPGVGVRIKSLKKAASDVAKDDRLQERVTIGEDDKAVESKSDKGLTGTGSGNTLFNDPGLEPGPGETGTSGDASGHNFTNAAGGNDTGVASEDRANTPEVEPSIPIDTTFSDIREGYYSKAVSDYTADETEMPELPGADIIAGTNESTTKAAKSTRGRKSLKTIDEGAELINIPPDEILFQKQYYAIGEVAEMFHVNQSLLRFWETEFDIIQPRKNRKGDRHFRPIDIKNLLLIHDLLRRRKLTIEGAKDFLKKNKRSPERFAMIQSLQKIKGFILEIKATL